MKFDEQEIAMLIRGIEMFAERERSLLCMVGDAGKKKIRYFINKYKKLVRKLERAA